MRTWVSSFAAALLMTVPLRAQPNDADQRASELFQRFEAAYAAGDVSGARAFMQQAFDLSRRSELLYNLAELDRELGDCRKASSEYADYLALTPAPGHRSEAVAYLGSLRAECPPPAEPPKALLPAEPSKPKASRVLERPYWSAPRVSGWALLGVSAVASVSTVYFALSMRATAREEEALVAKNNTAAALQRESWDRSGQLLEARGHREQTLTWGSGALALVTLGAGAYLLHRAAEEQRSPTWSLVVQRDRAVAGCSLRF
jgi:tetratricopeptide (TPR) repeat protein